MYKPPGVQQYPTHSFDFDISGRSGIAGTWVQITLKHSEDPIIKEAKPMYLSLGMGDSSSFSTVSPALTGVHSEKCLFW